jgi:hypothetical protein
MLCFRFSIDCIIVASIFKEAPAGFMDACEQATPHFSTTFLSE